MDRANSRQNTGAFPSFDSVLGTRRGDLHDLFDASPSSSARDELQRLLDQIGSGQLDETYSTLLRGGTAGLASASGQQLSAALAEAVADQPDWSADDVLRLPAQLGLANIHPPVTATLKDAAADRKAIAARLRGELAAMIDSQTLDSSTLPDIAAREHAERVGGRLGRRASADAPLSLAALLGGIGNAEIWCLCLPGAPDQADEAITYALGLLTEDDWCSLITRSLAEVTCASLTSRVQNLLYERARQSAIAPV